MFDPSSLRQAFMAASLVSQVALTACAGFFLGQALDGHLGVSPWLAIAFTSIGFLAGVTRLLLAARHLQDHDDPPSNPPP